MNIAFFPLLNILITIVFILSSCHVLRGICLSVCLCVSSFT